MKLEKLKYTLLFVATAFMWSCENEEYLNDSELDPANPTVSIDVPAQSITVDEADTSFTVNVSLSETQITDVIVNVFVSSGTATEGEDFDISVHEILIESGKTTGSSEISIYADEDTREEDETFTVTIGDEYTTNANISPVNIEFTINNTPDFATDEAVTLTFGWGGDTETAVGSTVCDDVDLDIYILYSDTATVLGDDVTGYAFATGSCPESASVDFGDGTYDIYSNVYETPDYGDYGYLLPIDVTLERFNNDGSVESSTSYIQPDSMAISTDSTGVYYVGSIVVDGGKYHFVASEGTETSEVKINSAVGLRKED